MAFLQARTLVASMILFSFPWRVASTEIGGIAIARTFSSHDVLSLPRSFDIWDTFPPCRDGSSTNVDLFLVFSQSLGNSLVAEASIQAVKQKFIQTDGWGKCISNVFGHGVGIEPSLDLYRSAEQDSNPLWVNGPNRQFERTIRSLQGAHSGRYEMMYLMEMDSVPVKPFWLNAISDEIHEAREFAILGSKYRGDKWDAFYDQLPLSLVNHINGNALYNLSHPLLSMIVDQLEAEAETVANSIPYDYRIAQIVDEVYTTLPPSFNSFGNGLNKAHQLPASFVTAMLSFDLGNLIRETPLVGNYASTNMVPVYVDNREVVIHGAKMRSTWDDHQLGNISLVVSDWAEFNSQAILSTLDASNHPFTKVVVLVPTGLYPASSVVTPTPVKFVSRDSMPDTADLCNADVDTNWFMMTNSYHQLRENLQLMTQKDGDRFKPVISSVSPDMESCYAHPTCVRDYHLAQRIHPAADKVYQASDFVFHTESRNAYCQFLESSFPKSSWSRFPSATSYVAFLERNGGLDKLYVTSDRKKLGSRPIFLPLAPSSLSGYLLKSRHLEVLNNTNTTNVTDGSGCIFQRTMEDCLIFDNCAWRHQPHACHPKASEASNINKSKSNLSTRPGWFKILAMVSIVIGCIGLLSLLVVGAHRLHPTSQPSDLNDSLVPFAGGDDLNDSLVPLAGGDTGGDTGNSGDSRLGIDPNGDQVNVWFDDDDESLDTIELDNPSFMSGQVLSDRHFQETDEGIEFVSEQTAL